MKGATFKGIVGLYSLTLVLYTLFMATEEKVILEIRNPKTSEETPESILDRFNGSFEILSEHIPEDMLLSQIMLTPSCGSGSRSIQETIKIFQLLMRLKERFA